MAAAAVTTSSTVPHNGRHLPQLTTLQEKTHLEQPGIAVDHVMPVCSHVMSVYGHVMSVCSHVMSVYGHVMSVCSHVMSVCGHVMSVCGHVMSV